MVQYLNNEICIWALITFKFYALTGLGFPFEEVFVLIFADAQKLKLRRNSKIECVILNFKIIQNTSSYWCIHIDCDLISKFKFRVSPAFHFLKFPCLPRGQNFTCWIASLFMWKIRRSFWISLLLGSCYVLFIDTRYKYTKALKFCLGHDLPISSFYSTLNTFELCLLLLIVLSLRHIVLLEVHLMY